MTRRIIRNTKQRNLLLECFKNNKDRHLTVEELYEMAKSIDSNIGIATVYRNVKLLEEQGVINKIELPDFLLAYEMCAFNSEHSHHHLICRKCGNIVDFEVELFSLAIAKHVLMRWQKSLCRNLKTVSRSDFPLLHIPA